MLANTGLSNEKLDIEQNCTEACWSKLVKYVIIIGILFCVLLIAGLAYIQHPKFGPKIDTSVFKDSSNFDNGAFQNLEPTSVLLGDKSTFSIMMEGVRNKAEHLQPEFRIPTIKTNLKFLDVNRDLVVWLGHSSYYMQLGGRRILIDPVFSQHASPVPFGGGAYEGTSIYAADDMPEIDYLLVSHEHWDHMDYSTIDALREKIRHVVCGLGLDQYFVRWGYAKDKVHAGDWFTAITLDDNFTIHIVPARHYTVRLFSKDQVLWAGFVLETSTRRIYYSGDSGYGQHIAKIAEKFKDFDLVIPDIGQYDRRWSYIHMTPEEAAKAAEELNARALLPAHVGKFTIANHPWYEPYERITKVSEGKNYRLLTPVIGETVDLTNEDQTFAAWWRQTSTNK